MRLFLGLAIPADVADHLELMACGLPGAHWQGRDKLHVTMRFLGDPDGGVRRAIIAAMTDLQHPAFSLTLNGMGVFPPRGTPRSLWLGLADETPVRSLRKRIDACLRTVDVVADARKFAPHVTLARTGDCHSADVAAYVIDHALVRSAPFAVSEVRLYSSVQTQRGSQYRVEAGFGLAVGEVDDAP